MKRLVATLLLGSIHSVAVAQGFRDEFSNVTPEDPKEVRQISYRYGDCVIKQEQAASSAFVTLVPNSDEEVRKQRQLLPKVADGDCLIQASRGFGSVQMKFPAGTLRYTLADALFPQELASHSPLTEVSSIAPLRHPAFQEADFQPKPEKRVSKRQRQKMADDRLRALATLYFSQLGECVVRADPSGAFALLKTRPVTPEEDAAFKGLSQALSACIVEGQTLRLNKSIFRGTVALNYYRLATAPRTLAPAAGAAQ